MQVCTAECRFKPRAEGHHLPGRLSFPSRCGLLPGSPRPARKPVVTQHVTLSHWRKGDHSQYPQAEGPTPGLRRLLVLALDRPLRPGSHSASKLGVCMGQEQWPRSGTALGFQTQALTSHDFRRVTFCARASSPSTISGKPGSGGTS